MRRPALLAMVTLAVVAASCGGDDDSGGSGDVVVFAAASLTEAFTEIGEAFEATDSDLTVTFNFAASSELASQIVEGAPADVFASADPSNMAKLVDVGANDGDPVVFARNRSAIVVAEGNPLRITGLGDLTDPDLVLVVCAPEVPCGTYATQLFDRAGIEVTPDSYEENVKAVVTKVRLGEADAGIAYATDVIAAEDRADGVEIPVDQNVVAEYPITVTSESPSPEGGRAFVDFVLSDVGQRILVEHGFSSP